MSQSRDASSPVPPASDAEAFLQWIADCVHVMTCPDCLAEARPLPAISQSAIPFLRHQYSLPMYLLFVRRLGGMLAPPWMLEREIDTAEYLMQERARSEADRHSRFLTALSSDLLRHPAALPRNLDPTTPPDSSRPGC